jgi:hypothetical protein
LPRKRHPYYTHSLPALKMLRIFLFGLSNRRKQPERYVQYRLKLVEHIEKYLKKLDKMPDIGYFKQNF